MASGDSQPQRTMSTTGKHTFTYYLFLLSPYLTPSSPPLTDSYFATFLPLFEQCREGYYSAEETRDKRRTGYCVVKEQTDGEKHRRHRRNIQHYKHQSAISPRTRQFFSQPASPETVVSMHGYRNDAIQKYTTENRDEERRAEGDSTHLARHESTLHTPLGFLLPFSRLSSPNIDIRVVKWLHLNSHIRHCCLELLMSLEEDWCWTLNHPPLHTPQL